MKKDNIFESVRIGNYSILELSKLSHEDRMEILSETLEEVPNLPELSVEEVLYAMFAQITSFYFENVSNSENDFLLYIIDQLNFSEEDVKNTVKI